MKLFKILRWFTQLSPGLLLRISAGLTLAALALMVWSVLDPTVWPVMIAMSVGQGIGTLAFAAFGWVVFQDLFRKRAERRSLQNIELARQSSQRLELVRKDVS
jgi:multidrug transporter EmrE-like cation transporter